MAVYSRRLADPSSPSFTVPSGYVAVVRDITAVSTEDGDAYIDTSYGGFLWASAVPNFVTQQWRGRQVFNEGESFAIVVTTGVYVAVSGYLLTA